MQKIDYTKNCFGEKLFHEEKKNEQENTRTLTSKAPKKRMLHICSERELSNHILYISVKVNECCTIKMDVQQFHMYTQSSLFH